MTDTTPKITFDDIVNIGKKRVNDTTTVEIPALGGSIVIRQLSGAQQDAAVAAAHAAPNGFDQHVLCREQIKASLVEPALPDDEADEIIDGLPITAFTQLVGVVQANSGLLPGVGVEQFVAMFRSSAGAGDQDGTGADVDHAGDALVGERLGSDDADADDDVASSVPVDGSGAEGGGSEAAEDRGAAEAVTA